MSAGCYDYNANVGYLSPEGIDLFGDWQQHLVGTKSDLWSVGCLLLDTLTNEGAFLSHEACQLAYKQRELYTKNKQRQWVCNSSFLSVCSVAIAHNMLFNQLIAQQGMHTYSLTGDDRVITCQ